jgi:hypothetical protein
MSKQQAARLMGYGDGKAAAERLSSAIAAGAIPYERLTRQRYVFSKNDFPKEAQSNLT